MISYTECSSGLNLGGGLCIFTSFHFPDSRVYLLNGFDFYFDLFWMAWHWKQAIRHDVTEREENPFLNFCAVETRKSAEKLAWRHRLVPRRLSISKKICTQRKAGRVKRHPSFLLPMVPCASSPVTRVLRYALSHEVPEKAVPEWSFPPDGRFSVFS